MDFEEKKKIIEETTRDLVERMGFKASIFTAITVSEGEMNNAETPISVEIQLEDSKFLIGKHGINLAALQHVLRVIIRKKTEERINFSIDINGYREEQKQALIGLANDIANRVIRDKKSMVLRPMSAYERRLVHMELAEKEGVKTESSGEGEERKIVVKPVSTSEDLEL